jgi:hypothetical protein
MIHISLADSALLLFLMLMTLLLVMFIGAVIVAPPAGPDPAHAAPEPPPPDPGPPARQPQTPAFPAGGLAAHTGSVVTHTAAPARLPPPGEASGGPLHPMRALGPTGLAFAGVALAVIGGLLFRRPVQGGMACSHHTGAICMQGFVLVTGTQVAGMVTALAGIALIFTAVVLALR